MKINHRRKMPKRRSKVVAPPSFRHTDKKHERSKRACRVKEKTVDLPNADDCYDIGAL